MLTDAEKIILEKWRTVRANAIEADRALTNAPGVTHTMPVLIAHCDAAIAELEAKAAAP